MIQLAYPYLLLLLFLPLIVRMLLPAVKGLHGDALRVPFFKDLQNISNKAGEIWKPQNLKDSRFSLNLVLLYLVWGLLVLAMARPQWAGEPIRLKNQNRDILMVLDISNSMREQDFALNRKRIDRLTAVKATAQEFLDKRADDRIGLVLFGTNAYLQSPLTFDKKSLSDILWQMSAGMAGQSTAIGDALGLSLKSLKGSPNLDRKIIILLTDGENNDGSLSVAQAVKLAQDAGVKIYTIGVGSENAMMASFMGMPIMGGGSQIDEKSLKMIAEQTKGRYFRAKDTAGLQKIYNEIDKMEPQENEGQFVQEIRDLYYLPLLGAWGLALLMAWLSRRKNNV